MGVAFNPSSRPLLLTAPMFASCAPRKPVDGATDVETSTSRICLLYHVNSMPPRPLRTSASKPSSVSVPRSGLRSGLPNALVRIADDDVEPSVTTFVEYVRDAAKGDGALPAAPHAPRSFTLFV